MGQGIAFRPGTFDGAISISALQWLFYPSKRSHNPKRRLVALFSQLYSSLYRGARAVFQFYPESSIQMNMAVQAALACGFTGGVVVDFPDSTKAKKYYLTVTAGTNHTYLKPLGLDGIQSTLGNGKKRNRKSFETQTTVHFEGVRVDKKNHRKRRKQGEKSRHKSKGWIKAKKERQQKQGKEVRKNSKYTGRRRPMGF